MKILLVNTYHYMRSGDCAYNFRLADLLRSKGHEVFFFAMKHPLNQPCAQEKYFVDYIDYAELNGRKNLKNGLQVLSRSIYYGKARSNIRALFEDLKPDIVHIQNLHAHITPSILFEVKKFGLPVFWTVHDYKLVCPNSYNVIDRTGEICEACNGGAFYHAVLNRCKKNSLAASFTASAEAYVHSLLRIRNLVDKFISPSAFLAEKLLSNGFEGSKVEHLPLFLPPEYFDYTPGNEDYVLFFGRLEKTKGISTLLKAAGMARGVRVVIAGRSTPDFQEDYRRFGHGNVRFVGFQSGNELRTLVKNSAAVVVPSIWYENQPFSILESFAFGKPVIASDLGGIKELIGNNERGILFPRNEESALSDAMTRLTTDSGLAARTGLNAFKYAKEYHDQVYHYEHLIRIYEGVRPLSPAERHWEEAGFEERVGSGG